MKLFKIRFKTGDKVIVLAGKYKGKTGKILKIHPKDNKVTVDGINIVKKHVKPTKDAPGSIQEIVKPMDVSKVAYYDQDTKGASKIEFKFDKDGKKIRIAKKSGKEIK